MFEYKAETIIEEGGTLHLAKLPFKEGDRVEVVISSAQAPRSWPKGYIESTFGSIKDDSFFRHDQGTYEVREELG